MKNKVIHCGIFHKAPSTTLTKKNIHQVSSILTTFRTRGACLVLLNKN